MRIIKDGVEMKVHCGNCNSDLAILPEDVDDCLTIGVRVMCPVCGKPIQLSVKDMSHLFRMRVDWHE